MAKIYDQPSKVLITAWAKEHLNPGQYYTTNEIAAWFMSAYPKFESRASVTADIQAMCVNNLNRRHSPSVKPGSGHDLFFKESPKKIRLWEPERDPAPRYKADIETGTHDQFPEGDRAEVEADASPVEDSQGEALDVLEKDLQSFLVRNLHMIEPGLRLFEEKGRSGIEYNAGGGRRIDILAVDAAGAFVVIELKVVRSYDKVIGQLQRYMGWVESNLANQQAVRGIIVASEITEDLILATSFIADRVKLLEYSLSFQIKQKER
jgi:endonuclease